MSGLPGETPPAGGERELLVAFLQAQRDLVAWKLAGADDRRLRAVLTPTGLGALGLVRHLTHVERWWFRDRFAGEAGLDYDWSDDDPDGEFWPRPGETLASILAGYAAESARCDRAVAGRQLDEVGADDRHSLRWVYLHLIEETARHLGHLDLLRERADGASGSDPGQVADQEPSGAARAARLAERLAGGPGEGPWKGLADRAAEGTGEGR